MTLHTLTRWCACAVAITIAAAQPGCRRRDPYTDAYLEITRAEKIDLEDQIYALEEQLGQRDREIEALRGRTPAGRAPSSLRPRSQPSPPVIDDSDLVPPSIDPGIPIEPRIELPPIEATPTSSSPAVKRPTRLPFRSLQSSTPDDAEDLVPPDLDEEQSPESLPAPRGVSQASFRTPTIGELELEDTRVTNLFINPFHTTGVDLDQQPGDDGITVLFEPRNAAGQFVPQTGDVTVVVLDPAAEGESARVARWELSQDEVGKRMLETRPMRGIRLQLKWPEKRPEHGKLKLFLRYTTVDGRQIETHSNVFVALPGEISQRWTPRKE